MANYYGVARTNYVTVDDLDGLEKALAPWPIEMTTQDNSGDNKVALLDNDPDGAGWPSSAYDDDDNEIGFDMAKIVMPFVHEGEVLVLLKAGHEKLRYVNGSAEAWVRRGKKVKYTSLALPDIYKIAAKKFKVDEQQITEAIY